VAQDSVCPLASFAAGVCATRRNPCNPFPFMGLLHNLRTPPGGGLGTPPYPQLSISAVHQKGGFPSTRARGKACLFPELLPVPDAGSFMEETIAELVSQHQNLAAMMRIVREHVSEHGPPGRPRLRPTAARELRNAAIRSGRESILTCAGTARSFACARQPPASWCSDQDRAAADTSDAARNSSATKDGCCAGARRWPRSSGHRRFCPAAGRAMHVRRDARG